MQRTYQFVKNLWNDAEAANLDLVSRLVYRSNKLGADQRITNTGGGNTSSKITEPDPLTRQTVEVMWVKGSGGDLRTSTRENFSSLYQSKLIALQPLYAKLPNNGPKTDAEDKMVGMYTHTTFNLNPRPSSIDTSLHSFLPGQSLWRDHDYPHPPSAFAVSFASEREVTGACATLLAASPKAQQQWQLERRFHRFEEAQQSAFR